MDGKPGAMPLQLLLPLECAREPSFARFIAGTNSEAVAATRALALGGDGSAVLLYGGSGVGKSHLIQAACLAARENGRQAHYLPLALPTLEPEICENLEQLDLIALDDLHAVAGDERWERALFGLFNRLRAHGRDLIASAHAAPDDIGLTLPDLRSRLNWGRRYRLKALGEADCERLLRSAAERLGMVLSSDLVHYIMTRQSRDATALLDLIDRLDDVCLRVQRPPTLPLLRSLLREASGSPSED